MPRDPYIREKFTRDLFIRPTDGPGILPALPEGPV